MFQCQSPVKYLVWTWCWRACFCGVFLSYSVRCKTPAKWSLLMWNVAPLSADVNVDLCLDVFLVCFLQNEDENRATESKKTKLEEKAPSGHKTSSSREWVSWLLSTLKAQGEQGEDGCLCSPLFSSSPTPTKCLLITHHGCPYSPHSNQVSPHYSSWVKCCCFLPFRQIYFRGSASSWWKLISKNKNVGQGWLFYLAEGT